MPPEGVVLKRHGDMLSYEQIIEVAEVAVSLGIKKIRLTGGEPLIRRGILHLIESIVHIPGLEELALTTNGVLLDTMAQLLKKTGIHRINISLDTLNPEKYKELTRGADIQRVLSGIDASIEAGFKNTKLNMVVMPGINENEVDAMKTFCTEKGLKLQRINHYSLTDIESIDHNYKAERPLACKSCNRIRLTADGKLKPCLFSNQEIPLDFSNLEQSLTTAIHGKPQTGTGNSTTQPWQIGG
jgi:cyclic pyranopterin phosphate synthase